MHADRTNRTMLIVLALLLTAAGAGAGAASFGLFGTSMKHRTLLHHAVGDFYGEHGAWLWPLTALVAAIMALLALRWLRALLFTTDRTGDLGVAGGGGKGRTTLAPTAVASAVVGEIESYRGVDTARARLVGDPTAPQLVVTVTVEDSADLAAVRRRIQTEALAHARSALDRPDLPARVDLTVTTRRGSRVA